jgi:hypothetical protein
MDELTERLARLETKVCLKFDEMDKALVLSREIMERRLAGMNEFQKRMDRLEGSFATRDNMQILENLVNEKVSKSEFQIVQRAVWIGIGAVVVLQIALRFVTL